MDARDRPALATLCVPPISAAVSPTGSAIGYVSGKELLIYEKGEDGVWRASRDIWNDGK